MRGADGEVSIAAAIALHDVRRYSEAARLYRCLLARRPDDIDALRLLGVALVKLNDAGRARAYLQRALACVGLHADVVADLGLSYHALGDIDRARLIWRIGAAIAPAHASIQQYLSALALAARQPAEAEHRYLRIKAASSASARDRRPMEAANLVAASRRIRPLRPDRTRYLLIRPWACGFWGEVHHVAVQFAFAEISRRVPIVYWGPEIRYGADGLRNAWDAYFEPVSNATLADLTSAEHSVFPPYWAEGDLLRRGFNALTGYGARDGISSIYLLNTEADIAVADGFNDMSMILRWADAGSLFKGLTPAEAYRQVFDTQIRPLARHRQRAAEIASGLFKSRPVLAVHYRTPSISKGIESMGQEKVGLDDYFRRIDGILAKAAYGSIFLMTDFEPAVGQFRDRYGDAIVTLPAARIGASGTAEGSGLDQAQETEKLAQEIGLDLSQDGYRLAVEVLTDALVATHADAFLGDGASGVTAAVTHLRNWPEDRLTLLRRPVFHDR